MKPILFNTDMVWAILEGRKTVTRRVIKPQPRKGEENPHRLPSGCWYFDMPSLRFPGTNDAVVGPYWPACQPGDILYVRETWAFDTGDDGDEIGTGYFAYKADDLHHPDCKWRPSIHMPKEAARIFLKVTDVRVERLQDMHLIDCLKEGVRLTTVEQSDLVIQGMRARERFSGVWDDTIKPADLDTYGWDANPWVWVIEFERCERPKEV